MHSHVQVHPSAQYSVGDNHVCKNLGIDAPSNSNPFGITYSTSSILKTNSFATIHFLVPVNHIQIAPQKLINSWNRNGFHMLNISLYSNLIFALLSTPNRLIIKPNAISIPTTVNCHHVIAKSIIYQSSVFSSSEGSDGFTAAS